MIRTLTLSTPLLLILLIMPFSVSAADSKTVVLDVPGMTCKFCPITIGKVLKQVPGVLNVRSDFETRTATVTFNSDQTNLEALTNATAHAGYKSSLKNIIFRIHP